MYTARVALSVPFGEGLLVGAGSTLLPLVSAGLAVSSSDMGPSVGGWAVIRPCPQTAR